MIEDNSKVELFYNNAPSELINNYTRGYYDKYYSLYNELSKKIQKTNNVDNIIKYNKDNKEIISRLEKIVFNFKDDFLQKIIETVKQNNFRLYSHIEINNEFEKIKLELLEKIQKDLPRKMGRGFFINRFYNNMILSNFKELSPLMYLRFNPKIDLLEKASDGYRKEYRALGRLNHLIKTKDYEGAYETLKYLKNYNDITKDLEKKLSFHLRNQLLFDIVSEHTKI